MIVRLNRQRIDVTPPRRTYRFAVLARLPCGRWFVAGHTVGTHTAHLQLTALVRSGRYIDVQIRTTRKGHRPHARRPPAAALLQVLGITYQRVTYRYLGRRRIAVLDTGTSTVLLDMHHRRYHTVPHDQFHAMRKMPDDLLLHLMRRALPLPEHRAAAPDTAPSDQI